MLLLEYDSDVVDPVALVIHLAVVHQSAETVSQVVLVVAPVHDLVAVLLATESALLVVSELTFEAATLGIFCTAATVTEAVCEVALVVVAVLPKVLTLAIWLVTFEAADQSVPIRESVRAVTLLTEVDKFPLISFALLVSKYAEALDPTMAPLADIAGNRTRPALPKSAAVLKIVFPLSVVALTVIPLEATLTRPFVLLEGTDVERAIGIEFLTLPVFAVVVELPFV